MYFFKGIQVDKLEDPVRLISLFVNKLLLYFSLKKKKAEICSWLVVEEETRDSKHQKNLMCCCWLEDERTPTARTWSNLWELRVAPGQQPAREWESQSYNHKKLSSVHNLNEFRRGPWATDERAASFNIFQPGHAQTSDLWKMWDNKWMMF